MDTSKNKKLQIGNWSVSVTTLVIIIFVLLFIIGMIAAGSSGESSGSSSTRKCGSCGRVFEAGDSGGNYMCIARTGMCNNCYNNFQWAQDVVGN